jgi:hypothetical protein
MTPAMPARIRVLAWLVGCCQALAGDEHNSSPACSCHINKYSTRGLRAPQVIAATHCTVQGVRAESQQREQTQSRHSSPARTRTQPRGMHGTSPPAQPQPHSQQQSHASIQQHGTHGLSAATAAAVTTTAAAGAAAGDHAGQAKERQGPHPLPPLFASAPAMSGSQPHVSST